MARKPTGNKPADIRRATIAEVLDFGLASASVNRIAKRAGLSVGTIYRHYPTKDVLLQVVYLDCKKSAHTAMLQALSNTGTPRERVRNVWFALLTHAFENPGMFAFTEAMAHSPLYTSEIRAEISAMNAPLQELLQDFVTSGALRPAPLPAITTLLAAPVAQIARATALGSPRPNDAYLEEVYTMCWRAVAQPD